MKIIFLDVDGVLNSHWSIHERWVELQRGIYPPWEGNTTWPHPAHIDALKLLIQETDAKIVVSSTWRLGKSRMDLEVMFGHFGLHGREHRRRIIGRTGSHKDSIRGLEILAWLEENKDIGCTSYVAIDDDVSDIIPHIGAERTVRTYFDWGLCREEVEEAINKLNAQG